MKRMIRSGITLLLLLTGIAGGYAQGASQPAYLDIGTKVNEYPKVDWLKGQPLVNFEKDKIYIIELWATWCMPCLESMPHLNALYQKFRDKNIIIIGQDVMEDDKGKVAKFVQQQGDAYSFPVAFGGGNDSDFYKKWIKPAGVFEIPQTFIIQNNTLVWQTSPQNLNEQVLELLIEGKFTIDAAEQLSKKKHQ
jgi:thiol-disulfide isomerase/thioredoxin